MTDYRTIAKSKHFIVLDQYTKEWKIAESYQSENDLEQKLIRDLQHQGYEFLIVRRIFSRLKTFLLPLICCSTRQSECGVVILHKRAITLPSNTMDSGRTIWVIVNAP